MNRTKMRELAFQLIYSCEIQKQMEDEQLELFINEEVEGKEQEEYITTTFNGIREHKEKISNLISSNLKEKWTMDRISKIDLAILEVAIFELAYSKLPYKIVINEAVELAKKYGADSSKSFVNGILASIVKDNEEKK